MHLDYEALYQRYLNGETGIAIAEDVGIDYTGLYRSWKRRGYELRSGSTAARMKHERRPELRQTILIAQAARRGGHDSMATRIQRAQTREAKGIGISEHERRLGRVLTELGVSFRQQAAFGPFNADFALDDLRLIIEVDGGGHNPRVRAMSERRNAYLESLGWRVVHVETRRQEWLRIAVGHATAS